MSAPDWLALGVLGGVGALLRFRLDASVQLRAWTEFPLGTLVVNVLGSLALGLLVGGGVGGDTLLLAGTGLLGSFTTFSTWMLETERLAEDGDDAFALLNLVLPAAAGVATALLGWEVGAVL